METLVEDDSKNENDSLRPRRYHINLGLLTLGLLQERKMNFYLVWIYTVQYSNKNWKRQGSHSSLEPLWGVRPAYSLISDFWPSRL